MRENVPIILALTLVAAAFVVVLALGFSVISGVGSLMDGPTAVDESARASNLAVQQPSASPTSMPLPTTPPEPTATPRPRFLAALSTVALDGIEHQWQTWNNCGPATLSMNLGYYGLSVDQAAVGSVLRRYADDKNVGPEELAAYARSQGLQSQVRVNGSPELLRTLLANNIPVLVETWYDLESEDGLGHYRLLTGYDDAAGLWIAYDSYDSRNPVAEGSSYQGIRLSYDELDALWRVFNRTYVLVYPPALGELVGNITASVQGESLGDDSQMWRNSHAQANNALAANPNDAFAWFNLGSSLLALGDSSGAARAFDQALAIGLPWRMLWYQFGPLDAYWQLGRYDEVIELANATIQSGAANEELYYWQGRALASLGRTDEARRSWTKAAELNPDFLPAQVALTS